MNAQTRCLIHSALYASSWDFPRSRVGPQFLSLLIRAMKADVSGRRRVAAFLKPLQVVTASCSAETNAASAVARCC
jgi:hypothetical protein